MAVLDQSGVPILALGDDSLSEVKDRHEAYLETGDHEQLLTGTVVYVDNRRPIGAVDKSDVTVFRIGSATLDEALKDVVGAFDGFHGHQAPRWVAASDERVAELLAEHYQCKVRPFPKAVSGGTRVAIGRDIESAALLQFGNSFSGATSASITATTYTTDSVNIPLNSVVGQYIVTFTGARRFGIIQSNTSAASSVLTIDRWYDATPPLPANVNVAAASAPTTGPWAVVAGQVPAAYMGLTATATVAVDGDTVLTGELNAAGAAGLNRQLATYAHTPAATTTTLTQTYTAAAADTLPVTVAQIGVFQGVVLAASRMVFRTVLNATMTFSLIGDQGQVTETVTL